MGRAPHVPVRVCETEPLHILIFHYFPYFLRQNISRTTYLFPGGNAGDLSSGLTNWKGAKNGIHLSPHILLAGIRSKFDSSTTYWRLELTSDLEQGLQSKLDMGIVQLRDLLLVP